MKTILFLLFATTVANAMTSNMEEAKAEAAMKQADIMVAVLDQTEASERLRKEIARIEDYVLCLIENVSEEFRFDFQITRMPVIFVLDQAGRPYARDACKNSEEGWLKESVAIFKNRRQSLDKMAKEAQRNGMQKREHAARLGRYLLAVMAEAPLVGYQNEIDELEKLCKDTKGSKLYAVDANSTFYMRRQMVEMIVITERLKQIRRAMILDQPREMLKNVDRLLDLKNGEVFYEQVAMGYRSVALWAMKDYDAALDAAKKAFCKDPQGPNASAVKAWVDGLQKVIERERQVQDTSRP